MKTIETQTVTTNSNSINSTEVLDVSFQPTAESLNTIEILFNDFFPNYNKNTTFAPPTTIVRKLLKS